MLASANKPRSGSGSAGKGWGIDQKGKMLVNFPKAREG